MIVKESFFDQTALNLAYQLVGKVIRHCYQADGQTVWLAAQIIETEAYEITEKGSHASLGFTDKRAALFMQPGTLYMYYARGADTLNFSARGKGNAVLVKSGYPFFDQISPSLTLKTMQRLNPKRNGDVRPIGKLCCGQTLLCKSLNLKVRHLDQTRPAKDRFYVDDVGCEPKQIIQCRRLGIPQGRDEHLMHRYVDKAYARLCTSNPLTKRCWVADLDYKILTVDHGQR